MFIAGYFSLLFHLTPYFVPLLAVVFLSILLLCKDVKNIFAILFYISFMIDSIFYNPHWVSYGISIGIAIVSMIAFFIQSVISKRKTAGSFSQVFENGKMFVCLIVSDVAFIFGGVLINFSIINTLVVIGFSVAVFIFYYIALNHTENLSNYLIKLFLIGGVYITILMLTRNVRFWQDFSRMLERPTDVEWTYVATQNINVVALFMFLGLIACFSLGYNSKYDYLFMAFGFCIAFFIILTACRGVILLTTLFLPIMSIMNIMRAKRKLILIIIPIIYVGILLLAYFLDLLSIQESISNLMQKFSTADKMSGRTELWTWCIEKFKLSPIFGYGFTSNESVPTMLSNIILSHNTIVQWICSVGLFGCVLLLAFYVRKYQIVLTKFFDEKIYLRLLIIGIALSGMVDQAASMDIFVYIISIVLVCSIERKDKIKIS